MASILIVDDDRNLCKILKAQLEKSGFSVLVTHDVDSALLIVKEKDLDLIITDLKMPGKSGMDLLSLSKAEKPAVPVILITAYGNVEVAVTAIKKGAYDFITKPFDEDELLNVTQKAISESQRNKELLSAYFDHESYFIPEFIGKTPAIRQIFHTVQKIAPTDSTVLITGETGVGKEIIARALHLASRRREHPFVKVNCAAIPENLLESELFGYEKGAFTGAITSKPGRFEIAHLGTLFLDEIGETPLHLQAKLLGVIQDKAMERVGGLKTIKIDIRIIAATNMDLHSAVQSGKFRSDLFYRLNVVPIHIPPLRERKEDLIPLVAYFLKTFAEKYRKRLADLSLEVMAAFSGYDWPGNIRELENVLERMVLMTDTETLGLNQLPSEIRGTVPAPQTSSLKEKMEDISRVTEKQMIIDALNKTNQNRTRAAELLGISRRTLQNKIREYGLEIPE
ncbi:MAG TPA: sigma-54 dependent transcriptional regulator [Thermodesulfobacteriota bacterium]|nr:sigma-54 dependent transcriptional regulator [Thermodesulfobacteriota bacterium]